MAVTAHPHRRILQVLPQALAAWTVVAVGAAMRGAAEFRVGAAARPATATGTLASALPNSSSKNKIKLKKVDVGFA